MDRLSIDTRLKSKIENMFKYENGSCSVKFVDVEDVFWFNDKNDLQEFLRHQEVERFFDKQLRKGYFDYMNENEDTLRYFVTVVRGKYQSVEVDVM